MPKGFAAPARVNVRLLLISAIVLVILVAGLWGVHRLRRSMLAAAGLKDGRAAFERGDWASARQDLGRWLSLHPDDPNVLGMYAEAQLGATPLASTNVAQAMSAYRRLLRVHPADERAYRRLALLYESTGSFVDLAAVAEARRAAIPDDPRAALSTARALYGQQRTDAARDALEALVGQYGSRADCADIVIDACLSLSELPKGADAAERAAWTDRWVERALAVDSESSIALVRHAMHRRESAARAEGAVRDGLLAGARQDLDLAAAQPMRDPRVNLQIAAEYAALGDTKRAQTALDVAKSAEWTSVREYVLDPDDWRVLVFAVEARLLVALHEVPKAVALVDTTLAELQDRPQRLQIVPLSVQILVLGGRIDDAKSALESYRDAVKRLTNSAALETQVALLDAVVAQATGDAARAITLLEPLAERSNPDPIVLNVLADAYARAGRVQQMRSLLDAHPDQTALSTEQRKLLVQSLLNRGDLDAARATLGPLSDQAASDPDIQLMQIALDIGEAERRSPDAAKQAVADARKALETLKQAHGDALGVRLMLASVDERAADTGAAEAELRAAVADGVQPERAQLALAEFLVRQRSQNAEAELRKATELDATRAAPWNALAGYLDDHGRTADAVALLRDALPKIASTEDRHTTALRAAVLEATRGDRAAGLAALRKLATDEPDDKRVRAVLLSLPEVTGDEAARLVAELRTLEGADGVNWRLGQARIWLEASDWREHSAQIADLLAPCIRSDPTRPGPVLMLGQMYERLGDVESAERTYRTGDSPQASERLLAMLWQQHRLTEARDLLNDMSRRMGYGATSNYRVMQALEEQSPAQALQELELRASQGQRDPFDMVLRAQLHYEVSNDADAALKDLDEAAAQGADPLTVVRVRAVILYRAGRTSEAEGVLNDLVAKRPTPEAYLLRAGYLASAGRLDDAQRDYEALAKVAEDDTGAAVLGEFHAQSGRLDEAIRVWEEGLTRYPDSRRLRIGLCKALMLRRKDGDAERSAALAAQLEKLAPNDPEALWVRAARRSEDGTLAAQREALGLVRTALDSNTGSAPTRTGLSRLALRLGDAGLAEQLAAAALQVRPSDPDALVALAQAQLAGSKATEARNAAREALRVKDGNLDALAALVESSQLIDDRTALRDARTRVEEQLRASPGDETLHLLLARCILVEQGADATIASLEAFCKTETGARSLPALMALHELYRDQRRFDQAGAVLDQAAALAPDNPSVQRDRLLLLAAQQRLDQVAALVAEGQPMGANPQLLLDAARLLSAEPARLGQALALATRAAALAPQDSRMHTARAELAYLSGDVQGAVTMYRDILKRFPDLPDAMNNLAWILADTQAGDDAALAEALDLARRAVTLTPTDSNFRDTLALVLQRLHRGADARAELERARDLTAAGSSARARILFRLAQVCAETGDLGVVKATLAEALLIHEHQPTFTPAEKARIDELLRLSGGPK